MTIVAGMHNFTLVFLFAGTLGCFGGCFDDGTLEGQNRIGVVGWVNEFSDDW